MSRPRTWTARVEWTTPTGFVEAELIDVEAPDESEATARVVEKLASDYLPGGVIAQLVRTGAL